MSTRKDSRPGGKGQGSRSGSATVQDTPGPSAPLHLSVLDCDTEVLMSALPASLGGNENVTKGRVQRSLKIPKIMLKVLFLSFLLLQIFVELSCSSLCLTSSISFLLQVHVPGPKPGLPPTLAKGISLLGNLPSAAGLLGAQRSANIAASQRWQVTSEVTGD